MNTAYYLHKRLYISVQDLLLADEYAEFIIKNKLHYSPWEKRGKIYVKQSAFTISLIVSYCRPFTRSNELPHIPKELIVFTKRQEKLHKKVLNLRHQVYAHSDGTKYTVEPFGLGDFSSSIYGQPFFKLSKTDAKELKRMILKIIKNLQQKQTELEMMVVKELANSKQQGS